MARWRPFVQGDSYMANKKWTPLVIGNGYTTTDGAGGPAPEYETVTGNPVSFNAITPFPLKQLSVAFSPVQSGTGDPSPDNVRPISGWSSLTLEQRGKNLFDADNLESVPYPLGTGSRWGHTFTKAGTYYLKAFTEPSGDRYLYGNVKNADGTYGNVLYVVVQKQIHALEVTLSEGQTLCIYNAFSNTEEVSSEAFNEVKMQVSYTETEPESFTPYNPSSRSISISFGQTVYSGWVDVISGVGEIDWAKQTFNGAETWTRDSSTDGFYRFIDTLKKASNYTGLIVCDKLKTYSLHNTTAYKNAEYGITGYRDSTGQYVGQNWIYAKAAGASTKEEFQAWLAENPIDVVYELAEPLTIQLTPQEVNSLAGDNTMWSNANQPITVEYRRN